MIRRLACLTRRLTRALAAGVAIAITSCDSSTAKVTTVATDSAGVRVVSVLTDPSTLPEWTLEPEPRRVLTGAETGDSAAFALVGSVRWLPGGGIVVGDVASGRLLYHNSDGGFEKSLGRRGDGPGEIRRLTSMTVVGDTVATFDAALRRLSFWHRDTGFVRGVSLADYGSLESFPVDAFPWRDSLVVVVQMSTTPLENVPSGSGVRRWPTRVHLTLRDTQGRTLQSSPQFDGSYSGLVENGDIRLPFAYRSFVSVTTDRVYFGSGERFEITYLNPGFTRAGEIRWPARSERLTSEEVERVRGEAIATISRRPLPDNPFAKNFAREILPESRPSIGRVLIDDIGNLWVERFEAIRMGMPEIPGDQWSVLNRDGEPIAVLKLPPRSRLEHVRGDEAIVVRRDRLDVQSIAIHRVRR